VNNLSLLFHKIIAQFIDVRVYVYPSSYVTE